MKVDWLNVFVWFVAVPAMVLGPAYVLYLAAEGWFG